MTQSDALKAQRFSRDPYAVAAGANEIARLKAVNAELVNTLKRTALLLEIVGKWMLSEQPNVEFKYDGSIADAWGCGTDCRSAAERARAAIKSARGE